MREGAGSWATEMRAIDASPQHHSTLVALRWALIAICAGFIAFSDHMAGRLGFAALLLLAVIVGRYGRGRSARTLGTPARLDPIEHPPQRHASEADVRHREAGQ